MIIEELVLENVGPYAGRHVIRLDPTSDQQPVILIRGLNGLGKTTLLESLHLGLYGRQAFLAKKGAASYDEYLRRLIHNRVDPQIGSGIEVKIRHRQEQLERTECIQRTWRLRGDKIHESAQVLVDGRLDAVLSESWGEHIESLLPSRLARLFFFDGEQIAQLADIQQSSALLQAAIHALLGLDLVDQLNTDLIATERRQRLATAKQGADDATLRQAELTAAELRLQDEQVQILRQQESAALVAHEKAQRLLAEVDASFRSQGGEALERRHQLEVEQEAWAKQIQTTEEALRSNLAGDAPLLLVSDQLRGVSEQAEEERRGEQQAAVVSALETRDRLVIDFVTKLLPKNLGLHSNLQHFLEEDRARLQADATNAPRILELSDTDRGVLASLVHAELAEAHERLCSLLHQLTDHKAQLVTVQRRLARVPSPEALEVVVAEKSRAEALVHETRGGLKSCVDQLAAAVKVREKAESKVEKAISELETLRLCEEERGRMSLGIQRTRETLDVFRHSIVERHAWRIEAAILSCYRSLLRKQSLISAIRIDPEDFTVTLLDPRERPLPPDDLSAGERQLLAVAILWGLAKESGRPLPAVIDTPLGRLDSSHRRNLVRYYFPHASHQVILLSTDEEVTGVYLDELRPHVSRAYELRFDEVRGCTTIAPLFSDAEQVEHASAS